MNEIQVSFRSGDLTLEGLLANPGGNAPAAVVCHPHPMYGGSMYNNVVDAMLAAMWQAGTQRYGSIFAASVRAKASTIAGRARSTMRWRRWRLSLGSRA
jgi:alpha/beta superfamily hydrolase